MRFAPLASIAALIVVAFSNVAFAQQGGGPGFFGGGVVKFNPEISVVNSGALVDAQAVVSADRKYVTINMRPSLSHLQALNVFPVGGLNGAAGGGAGGGAGGAQLGFVGGAGYIEDDAVAAAPAVPPGTPQPAKSAASAERAAHAKKPAPIPASPVNTSPSEILKIDPTAANSVLRKEGMFLIEWK